MDINFIILLQALEFMLQNAYYKFKKLQTVPQTWDWVGKDCPSKIAFESKFPASFLLNISVP